MIPIFTLYGIVMSFQIMDDLPVTNKDEISSVIKPNN